MMGSKEEREVKRLRIMDQMVYHLYCTVHHLCSYQDIALDQKS